MCLLSIQRQNQNMLILENLINLCSSSVKITSPGNYSCTKTMKFRQEITSRPYTDWQSLMIHQAYTGSIKCINFNLEIHQN